MNVGITSTVVVAIPVPVFEAVKDIFPLPGEFSPTFGICVLVQS